MRPDGRFVRFDDNAAVLINKKNEMIGTRIGGVVSSDLRLKGWGKVVALAPKVRRSSKKSQDVLLTCCPGNLDYCILYILNLRFYPASICSKICTAMHKPKFT